MIKIAIDAMGSDLGSPIVVEAIKNFLKDYHDVEFSVVGRKEQLKSLEGMVEIINSDEVMGMEDGALEVMRQKNTSMLMAIDLVANKQAQAVVSAGSTGAFLTGATLKLKLIPNVLRAALVSPFPCENGRSVTILDIGANNENTPAHLVQFAKIGSVFARKVGGVTKPRVYLLSNGAEAKKGSPVVKEAHKLIEKENTINFKGNIEARYVLSGEADVVVCEGYPGNVLLKSIEGTASMMNKMIKDAFKMSLFSKVGYVLASKGFKQMKGKLDYKKYGGAMLLGVNGVVVKGHGSSDAYAFYNAIRVAYEMVKLNVIEGLKEAMQNG